MVEESSEKIVKLKNYSDEVGGLVDLIHSISSETKMLSLNASIEAARAGEEGRGFSVVAMEVGKLAEETDKASKKIEGVILGRPKGKKSAPEKYKLHDKRILIQELLKAEVSQRKIAKICKVDRNTLARFIKTFMVEA